MEREPDKSDFDIAEIWRRAQQRREQDIGTWLANYFEKRRLDANDAGLPNPAGWPRPI